MLLSRDSTACLAHAFYDGLTVQRFNRMDIDDLCRDTLLFQLIGCFYGLDHHVSGGEDAHVFPSLIFQALPITNSWSSRVNTGHLSGRNADIPDPDDWPLQWWLPWSGYSRRD